MPDVAQMVGVADAREHQELRRVDGAGAQDDFPGGGQPPGAAGRGAVGDAGGPTAVELDALDQRAGDHFRLRPPGHRYQISIGGTESTAAVLGYRGQGEAGIVGLVELVQRAQTLLGAGGQERDG